MRPARALADGWIGLLAAVSPPLAFAWAGREGRLAWRLGRRGPAVREVARLFSLPPEPARGVALRMAETEARRRAFARFALGHRADRLERHLRWKTGQELLAARVERREPAVLVMAPWGPRLAMPAALGALGADALIVGNLPWLPASWGLEVAAPAAGGLAGAATLQLAVERLRAGGRVLVMFAGTSGPAFLEVPFLGGSLALRRGLAAVARLGGAPLLPVTVAWGAGSRPLELAVHSPIPAEEASQDTAAADRRLLARLARRFEDLLRAAPGECSGFLLRQALAGPLATNPGEESP